MMPLSVRNRSFPWESCQGLVSHSNILEGRFDDALNFYSEAIYCDVPNDKKAIYYNNRALVNLKMENYAIALFGTSLPP